MAVPNRNVTPEASRRTAIAELLRRIAPVADELGVRFAAAGHELALVGGPVRDALLRRPTKDVDLTTDAPPERTLEIIRDWADAHWTIGIDFGTVGLRKNGVELEITTYRSESYDPKSRKPDVSYGTSLVEDLRRRDFAVNAMAARLPGHEFVDPFGGLVDLQRKVLRTPGRPEDSFNDDPLRMMRAARFASQLGFEVAPDVVRAMTDMAPRIEIVSAERIRDELSKLICGLYPRQGLALLVDTGLADHVLPELPKLRLEIDEHHRHKDVYEHSLIVLEQAIAQEEDGPDLVLRLAALLHDIGKPRTRRFESGGRVSFHHHEVVGAKMTRKRLTALRYPKDVISDVSRLVELHLRFHGYGTGEWTDSAVRRYVRDAGPLLSRLHKLTRADCTTRNRRKADRLRRTYDDLELRIERLAEEEELAAMRPELDGNEIQEILGIPPGPLVGKAYRFLLDLRLDRGLIGKEAAEQELRTWAATATSSGPTPPNSAPGSDDPGSRDATSSGPTSPDAPSSDATTSKRPKKPTPATPVAEPDAPEHETAKDDATPEDEAPGSPQLSDAPSTRTASEGRTSKGGLPEEARSEDGVSQGGASEGSASRGGASEGGASEGGASEGGASEGGASEGSASRGGASEGGASEGGASEGGASEGGASVRGSSRGGASEGGASKGGASEGSASGESAPGGGAAEGRGAGGGEDVESGGGRSGGGGA